MPHYLPQQRLQAHEKDRRRRKPSPPGDTPVYGAVDPVTNEPIKVEVRSCDPARDYRWPIPQREILANPKMEQNDKY